MRTVLNALALTLAAALPLAGQGTAPPASMVEVGLGVPGVLDDAQAVLGMVGVRFPVRVLEIGPMAGLMGTSEGQMFAYAGVYREFALGPLVFTATFAAGDFEKGRGRDLGGRLQFRSVAELGRRLEGGHRISVQLAHLSNGGLGWRNPGQERLLVTWLIPF